MKRIWIVVGGIVVLVVLLVGAAFVAGLMIRQQQLQAQANKGDKVCRRNW